MTKLSLAPFLAVTAVAAGMFLGASADPAMALCKYGTPHCVNPNPGPKPPAVGGAQIPGSGWQDPDCQYYHNCGYTSAITRQPTTGTQPTGQIQTKK